VSQCLSGQSLEKARFYQLLREGSLKHITIKKAHATIAQAVATYTSMP
jgi:hypothetical protein